MPSPTATITHGEWAGEPSQPPPFIVRYDGVELRLFAFTYCYVNTCADGLDDDPPSVGSPAELLVFVPVPEFTQLVVSQAAGSDGTGQQEPVQATGLGHGWWSVRPGDTAGDYLVDLFATSEGPGGDMAARLRWTVPGAATPGSATMSTATKSTTPQTTTPQTTAPQTTVDIDMFSGRENPRVTLDAGVAEELHLMVGDHAAAGLLRPGEAAGNGLGFRGFVVTPADPARPRLRILPTEEVVDGAGLLGRLDDPGGSFYNRVYDAIRPLVSDDVWQALPDSNPAIPRVTATIPPLVGVTGTWTLAHPEQVFRDSTSIDILVTRLECSGGMTGKLLVPVVSLGTGDIVIRADAAANPPGAYTCLGNDAVAVTVTLPEPIGNRSLADAACLAGEAVRTANCQTGAIRRAP
jgi:hypothetical protein